MLHAAPRLVLGCLLGLIAAVAVGCGSSNAASSPTPGWASGPPLVPPSQPVDPRIAIWANECADLVGTINAGINFVGAAGADVEGSEPGEDAESDDATGLAATADALDSVAREIESKTLTHPDLARLASWYAGVSHGLATTTREADAALAASDDTQAAKVAEKAEALTQQESTIVDEINRVCEPFAPQVDPAEDPIADVPVDPSAPVPAPPPPASGLPAPAPAPH